MKKYRQTGKTKKSKRFAASRSADLIEELNAVSATDFTGLIPANPNGGSEDEYEDIFPNHIPQNAEI